MSLNYTAKYMCDSIKLAPESPAVSKTGGNIIWQEKSLIRTKNKNTNQKRTIIDENIFWRKGTVKNILEQELLTGDMVQGKTISYSHKVKKRVPLPREKWCTVETTHETIIDRTTFRQVQVLLAKETRPKTTTTKESLPSILSGYIECIECGQKMIRTMSLYNKKKYYYFRCKTNKKYGNVSCSNKIISEDVIVNVLLIRIITLINSIVDMKDVITKKERDEIRRIRNKQETELSRVMFEQKKILNIKTDLYQDYKDNIISLDDYLFMFKEFEKRYHEISNTIKTLENEIMSFNSGKSYNTEVKDICTKYKGITKLIKKLLSELVEKITVDKDRSIKTTFKFQDEIKNYLKIATSNI